MLIFYVVDNQCKNCRENPCKNGNPVNKPPHRLMKASLGKIDPGMDEEEMENLLLTVETSVRGVGKTANDEPKYNTRVQRFIHQHPEDWSYPTDWKKQDCHYYCLPQE